MSNLLSLDQSSKITGYAVFEDNKLKTFGKFAVEDNNIDTRLVKIRQKIKDLIEQYHIDEVVFEDIQQQNNISNNVLSLLYSPSLLLDNIILASGS